MSEVATLFDLLLQSPPGHRDISGRFTHKDASDKLQLKLGLAGKEPWWPAVRDELGDQLRTMLHPDVGDVLLAAWKDRREIQAMCEETKRRPGSTQVFHGPEQTIKCHQDSTLTVLINGVESGLKLDFTVSARLSLESLQLVIGDGRVRELRPGPCKFAGTLSLGDIVLVERETAPIQLPGRIEIRDRTTGRERVSAAADDPQVRRASRPRRGDKSPAGRGE